MENENPIRTLGNYSKPSHKGYKNTIELLAGNNVDPNHHLKDFLKLVDSLDLDDENRERTRLRLFQFSLRDQASNWLERLPAGSISIWEDLTTRFLSQFFPPGRTVKLRNDILIRAIDQSASGKLRDLNPEESWAILEDLALYDNKKGLVSEFMASQEARLSRFEADFKRQQGEMTSKIDTVLKAITNQIAGTLPSDTVKNPKLETHPVLSARSYLTIDPQCSTQTHISINIVSQTKPPILEETDLSFDKELKDLHLNLPVIEALAHAP
ncbi:MAK10-like protein [Tanacetum coccineum]